MALTANDLEQLAGALERSNSHIYGDELADLDGKEGTGIKGLPAYSRVLIETSTLLTPEASAQASGEEAPRCCESGEEAP